MLLTDNTIHGTQSTNNGVGPIIPELTPNSEVVLKKRYLLKDHEGKIKETPTQLFERVSSSIAAIDKQFGATDEEVTITSAEFYHMLATLEFLPNSPTLMNAGTGAGTLSACFVLPLPDSMDGIMQAATSAAMVQKYGGGTGFALSELRHKDAPIATTHGKACGPIAVLKLLSAVSTLVTQGGKRDGANMAVMNVQHPDILEFIDCKAQEGSIHNFNISVGATDQFMKAVVDGTDYPLLARDNPADPESKMVTVKHLNAREVFAKIIRGAWRNGEPGMIFLDEVNRDHPARHLGEITATNPCGEQPLLPNESCNLGSIDLGKFVITQNDKKEKDLDWDRLRRVVHSAIHFLDNVIDANKYAVEEIRYRTKHTRKLGLGVMGFADMLVLLDIPYDSDEGVDMGRKVMRFIKEESDKASLELGEQRGPFPGWEGSQFQREGKPYRNACRLTVAPTGTISMIAGASSGIEPLFSLAYRKQNILGEETLYYVNEAFEGIAKEQGFYSDELRDYLTNGGSLQERDGVSEDVRTLFKVSADISPERHVQMQAAFQESTDAGISKTINFPNSATEQDVEQAYILAWKTKCKGITVYRAGSRDKEVLTTGHSSEPLTRAVTAAAQDGNESYAVQRERPAKLNGLTHRVRTGRGNLYVTTNLDEHNRLFEVFTNHGKAGGNDSAMAEALSRMISLALRTKVHPRDIVSHLRGITDKPFWDNGQLVRSVPDAIAQVIDRLITKELNNNNNGLAQRAAEAIQPTLTDEQSNTPDNYPARISVLGELCPDCSYVLAHEEGCEKCHACGYSKC